MATDDSQTVLACISCDDVITVPVTLHCGHSFCASCVTGHTYHIQQRPDARSLDVLSCPLCNGETRVPDPQQPLEEWARQVGTVTFVKNLADTVTEHAASEHINCSICTDGTETKDAAVWCPECGESLCSDCEKVHRKLHSSHTATDVTQDVVKTVPRRARCERHDDAIIDLLCEDCDEAVCPRCCILDHKRCKKVLPLEESALRIESLLQNMKCDLKTRIPKLEERISFWNEKTERHDRNYEEDEERINEICDDLVAEIRHQQSQLTDRLKQIKDEADQALMKGVRHSDMLLKDAQQRMMFANKALSSSTVMDCYEVYKIFSAAGTKNKSEDEEFDTGGIVDARFIDNTTSLMTSLRRVKVGYIIEGTEKDDKGTKAIQFDIGRTGVHDLTVVSLEGTKTIVVTHPGDRAVHSFHISLGTSNKNFLKLDSPPYGITNLEPPKTVAAVPKKKQLVVLSVGSRLHKDSIIKTQLRYIGLACLDATTLACSCEDVAAIDVIDLSGARLRCFGIDMFLKPLFLHATLDNKLLVSDWKCNKVVCVSLDGTLEFEYQPGDNVTMGCPLGVCQSLTGDIYIADKGNHKVIQLSPTGRFVEDRLTFADEVSDPRAVYVDQDNVMYVTVDDRFVHSHNVMNESY
ncbi:E3 ubiquitin-protein ligase TRIM71-like [Haliotis asinina]|uniref:E3 ubiquitin-protein ligase TRIM71-like n=1 Tax=Haliotis asinina TaxID=109174 RepID=UPI0035320D70